MTRFLIVLGILFAGAIALCSAGFAVFTYSLARVDPYPALLADYRLTGAHSYQEAERAFSEFVAKTFPIGSDAKDAIAQINKAGFRVITSGPDLLKLLWERRAGPCNEHYLIVVSQSVDGRITKSAGQLQPICL